ncbi:hypothetical protein M7I_5239 [Glarea lozoyensis 74030]|uniref:Uncharacterized protein n=1 Tax=Glarea lozoyensis (strain ATCC 74030 / MF5533) TaxID=1104152 RepID=H0ERC0_GLAL7|nr:hypothetical protein M7I_5239 [Glarea lozoyensis 74030]
MIAFGVGAFGEAAGYVGRLLLRNDPFSRTNLHRNPIVRLPSTFPHLPPNISSLGAVIASRSTKVSPVGNNIMMVGLCSQVFTLLIFGLLSLDVFLKIRSFQGQWNESTLALRNSSKFKGLLAAIVTAVMCIVACLVVNVWHPGFLFQQSYATTKAERAGAVDGEMVERA